MNNEMLLQRNYEQNVRNRLDLETVEDLAREKLGREYNLEVINDISDGIRNKRDIFKEELVDEIMMNTTPQET